MRYSVSRTHGTDACRLEISCTKSDPHGLIGSWVVARMVANSCIADPTHPGAKTESGVAGDPKQFGVLTACSTGNAESVGRTIDSFYEDHAGVIQDGPDKLSKIPELQTRVAVAAARAAVTELDFLNGTVALGALGAPAETVSQANR